MLASTASARRHRGSSAAGMAGWCTLTSVPPSDSAKAISTSTGWGLSLSDQRRRMSSGARTSRYSPTA
ncbi:MAG: hypothetical protein C4333_05470 [Meiothermus sp.]